MTMKTGFIEFLAASLSTSSNITMYYSRENHPDTENIFRNWNIVGVPYANCALIPCLRPPFTLAGSLTCLCQLKLA